MRAVQTGNQFALGQIARATKQYEIKCFQHNLFLPNMIADKRFAEGQAFPSG
jgi:hypothetical protein